LGINRPETAVDLAIDRLTLACPPIADRKVESPANPRRIVMAEKPNRDVEKVYSTSEFVSKLRRLADALETGERFEIQVAGERIYVPARAEFNVEHEREGNEEEIEFQLKWTNR
jgi:amphi-Trp domain-containing protein